MAKKYERLVNRRKSLMKQFDDGEITRDFYLKEMGAISLKADKVAGRLVEEDGNNGPTDSDSETPEISRVSDDISIDQDDPFAAILPSNRRRRNTRKEVTRAICPVCSKGFQLRRNPPLHTVCKSCKKTVHNRCLRRNTSTISSDICYQCNNPSGEALLDSLGEAQESCPSFEASPLASTVRNEDLTLEELGEGDIVIPFHGLPPPRVLPPILPSYTEFRQEFDIRMDELGFQRSPTQTDTIADGNCALYALMDQLHQPYQDLENVVDLFDTAAVRLVHF